MNGCGNVVFNKTSVVHKGTKVPITEAQEKFAMPAIFCGHCLAMYRNIQGRCQAQTGSQTGTS